MLDTTNKSKDSYISFVKNSTDMIKEHPCKEYYSRNCPAVKKHNTCQGCVLAHVKVAYTKVIRLHIDQAKDK
ncbi:hypothetical protein EJB05_00873, partial [Eragrostis curvula]